MNRENGAIPPRPEHDAAATPREPARVAHRLPGRLRLRIPSRRHDLGYFLALYDELRARPEIDEVRMNPATGSVLLLLADADAPAGPGGPIEEVLRQCGLEPMGDGPAPTDEPHASHHAFHMSINDMRILVFVIMAGLSVHQLMKGQLLAPALTMLLYLADLAAAVKMERDAAAAAATPPVAPPR